MMICMAGLQVFIVRFFFQVCCSCGVWMSGVLGLTGGYRVLERATCEGNWALVYLGGIGGLEGVICSLIEMTSLNEMPKVEYQIRYLVLYSVSPNCDSFHVTRSSHTRSGLTSLPKHEYHIYVLKSNIEIEIHAHLRNQ
jgi:hypothetical protein